MLRLLFLTGAVDEDNDTSRTLRVSILPLCICVVQPVIILVRLSSCVGCVMGSLTKTVLSRLMCVC